MALRNVANAPMMAQLETLLNGVLGFANRIPVRYWWTGGIALASVWACYSLASLVWYLVPSARLPIAPVLPAQSTAMAAAANGRTVDFQALQSADLFGNSVAVEDTAPVVAQQSLERTRLDLELQGIIAAMDPKLSWAIIGKPDNQKLYKIGDIVEETPGVKVAEIYPLKVIINNNGTLEELWLYGEDGMNVANNAATPPPTMPVSDPGKATVSRDQLEQARNIGDVVRFMVATENGKMIGYRVRPGRKHELFDSVGLKNDDIVVSVNGIEVNEPQKVREVYQALQNATEANLEVMRDGSRHSIQITMSAEG